MDMKLGILNKCLAIFIKGLKGGFALWQQIVKTRRP